MAAIEKFFFDQDFDIEPDPVPSAAEAEPEPEPEPPAPTYSQEDLDAAQESARQAGWNAGFAAGETQARDAAEEALTAATTRVAAGLDALFAEEGRQQARRDEEALGIAVKLVETLFPELTRSRGLNEIEAVLAEALDRLREEPRVVVRVADSLLDPLQQRIEAVAAKAGYPGKTILLADESVPEGDVRVEWADGGAERDTDRLWREVHAMLARAAQAQSGAAQSKSGAAGASGEAKKGTDTGAEAGTAESAQLHAPAESAAGDALRRSA